MPITSSSLVDRRVIVDAFLEGRARSRRLFDLVSDDAYTARPIPLRHPIVFYEGHFPAFNVNTLLKRALGHGGIDGRLETLFARGIDPPDEAAATRVTVDRWPSRAAVQRYAEEADRAVLLALKELDGVDVRPEVRQALFTILEHELMHQETLLYIFHRLSYDQKRRPVDAQPVVGGTPPPRETRRVPAGSVTLGADPDAVAFGWDNEFPVHHVDVDAFDIDVHDVTNADFLEFVEAGGYEEPSWWSDEDRRWLAAEGRRHPPFWERRDGRWFWRGMFELVPLPPAWPVYVSHGEAVAYARSRGRRLPTEAEYHRAAYATPTGEERAYPWGDAAPDASRGAFDFRRWDPEPVGSHPAGRSAWDVEDLVGNGWEWTATVFEGFPGFQPMWAYPQYSADFFDGRHWVMKGGSVATAAPLLRRSFRNWFRAQYPYAYATFRCAASVGGSR